MNERIKELITECETAYVDWLGRKYVEFDKEKFAQLVARRCIQVALDADDPILAVEIADLFGITQ